MSSTHIDISAPKIDGVDDHTHNLEFSNILAYIGGCLMLDVEGNTNSSLAICRDHSPPLAINGRYHYIAQHSAVLLTSLCQILILRSMNELSAK